MRWVDEFVNYLKGHALAPERGKPREKWGRPELRIDRLERLLEHMERGRLSVERFDFAIFHEETSCGTIGCMGGELPAIFPEWELEGTSPRLKEKSRSRIGFRVAAGWFFGLSWDEVTRLFFPGEDFVRNEPSVLRKNATREEVTANLRAFIEEKRRWEVTRG